MSYAILFLIVCELGIHVFDDTLWAKVLFTVVGGICFGILCRKERRLKERITSLESELILTKDQMVSFQEKNNSIFEKIGGIIHDIINC